MFNLRCWCSERVNVVVSSLSDYYLFRGMGEKPSPSGEGFNSLFYSARIQVFEGLRMKKQEKICFTRTLEPLNPRSLKPAASAGVI